MASVDLTRVNSNIAALNTLNALRDVNKNLALHQTRLASGKRINEAADDPAGLTLATKFQVRADSLQQAMDNIGDAKNLLSVAEGGLKKINDILGKMRIKAEAAASDTLGSAERAAIKQDLEQFAQEIDDIVAQTTWNGNKLLDGLVDFAGNQIVMQTGADAGQTTTLNVAEGFTSVQVQGGALGTLATIAAASSAVGGAFSAGTTGAASTDFAVASNSTTTAGLTEGGSGTYTIRMVISDINDAAGGTLQVQDASGNFLSIDNGSGIASLSRSFSTAADSPTTFNLGNGLEISFDDSVFTATGTATLQVNYTKQGSYSVDVSNATLASTYMTNVDSAISTISARLQKVGSLVSRLNFKEENLAVAKLNTESAFNRIMNADMAQEQLESVKFGILQQTATAMLAQTNTAPQMVLQLFR